MPEFTKLFEPGKWGRSKLKNRIIFAPCGTHYSSHYGEIIRTPIGYYAERARGGTGL